MVNAYKLVLVAKRLKEKGWPERRAQLLNDKTNFDFKDEARRQLAKSRDLLKSSDCKDRELGFKALRAAYLLDHGPEAAEELGKRYEASGFAYNAVFYRVRGPQGAKILGDILFDKSLGSEDKREAMRSSIIRALPAMANRPPAARAKEAESLLERTLSSDFDLSYVGAAEYVHANNGPKLGEALTSAYQKHPHLRQSLLMSGLMNPVKNATFFCSEALRDDDWPHSASLIIGGPNSKACEKLIADKITGSAGGLSEGQRESFKEKLKYNRESWDSFFKRNPQAKSTFDRAMGK